MNSTIPVNAVENQMSNKPTSHFTLVLPYDVAFVTIARLVIAGIANHARFSYDELEDIKIAVGEVFNFYLNQSPKNPPASIKVQIDLQPDYLNIETTADGLFAKEKWKNQGLTKVSNNEISSRAILEHLVDTVQYEETTEGSIIRIQKKYETFVEERIDS